jgi:Tfp pilus assembly protein PilF
MLVSCGGVPQKPSKPLEPMHDPAAIDFPSPSRGEAGKGSVECSIDAELPKEVHEDADAETLHSMGQERILAREGQAALSILSLAHEKEPLDASILCDLATAMLQCRMYDEAIARVEKAAILAPNDVDIAANKAQTYQIAGRIDDAVIAYRRALKVSPDDAAAHNNLAVLLALKDPAEAETEARKATELDPTKATYLINLGYVLFRLKRLVDAEAILRRAVELDPKSADAFNQLGLVMAAQERGPEAKENFRKALDLNPKHRAAKENLDAMDEGFDFTGPWDEK